jgi:hypothetical protein
MNLQQRLGTLGLATTLALAVALSSGCPNPAAPPPGSNVTVITTGTPGATSLAATADGSRIYLGHITYGDGGALKYYDTNAETILAVVEGVDVGDFVLDEANNQLIGISSAYSPTAWTYAIDLGTVPYTAVEILDSTASSFVGGDILLHGGSVYVLNTAGVGGWPPTGYDNTLYYFPADDFDPVTKVSLGTNQPYSLARMAVYNNKLYLTDTAVGKVYSSDLDGDNFAQVTTAGDGAAGMIYFQGGKAFVADGLAPDMGVFTFDPASPPGAASHFGDSAATSAQFMAFVSSTQAFVTDFGGGVYAFDPSDIASPFTIVPDTDLSYVDGINGYGFQDVVAANGHLYVAVGTFMGDESELMIVDSY